MSCSRKRQQRREQRRLAALQVLEHITSFSSKRETRANVMPKGIDHDTTRDMITVQPPAYTEAVIDTQTRSSTEKGQLAELEEMERRHANEKHAIWARFSKPESKGY
ncbi:hypothetical protein MBLNU457_1558t1 [Dothideomycetes sp. NU457]